MQEGVLGILFELLSNGWLLRALTSLRHTQARFLIRNYSQPMRKAISQLANRKRLFKCPAALRPGEGSQGLRDLDRGSWAPGRSQLQGLVRPHWLFHLLEREHWMRYGITPRPPDKRGLPSRQWIGSFWLKGPLRDYSSRLPSREDYS